MMRESPIVVGSKIRSRQPMTDTQIRMFISQGAACYRLPFAYALHGDEHDIASLTARVHRMLTAHPGLASTFEYDGRGFFRTARPDLIRHAVVTDAGPVESLFSFCADESHIPPLGPNALPVTAFRCTVGGQAHLVLEFHHIAVDGIGAVAVEESLFPSGGGTVVEDAERIRLVYEHVAAAEKKWPRRPAVATLPLPGGGPPAHGPELGRLRVDVATSSIADLARRHRSFPRVAIQAAFEEWLHTVAAGSSYVWVSSWRYTLGIREVVANLPVLVVEEAGPHEDLRSRCTDLMLRTADPVLEPSTAVAATADVVFSYEDFRYRTGRFISVDTYPRFALYARAVVDEGTTTIHLEFDRSRVDEQLARSLLAHLDETLTA